MFRFVRHRASPKFWKHLDNLPEEVRNLARENFELLKRDARQRSLHFKKVDRFWSARVGLHYRAVGVEEGADIVWFWIGHHSEYDRLISTRG